MKTIVKVYLKDEHGNEDWFVTPINLPEQEAHENYIGKRFNIGIDTDHMMKCWKVETLRVSWKRERRAQWCKKTHLLA